MVFRLLIALTVVLLGAAPPVAAATGARSPSIDRLMGGEGRSAHEKRLARLSFPGGENHSWQEFSEWGRELFLTGSVQDPPQGSRPSPPISRYYACVRCHNDVREDPELPDQDPEARFRWSQEAGVDLFLAPAVTLWGAVNRVSFYNGHYHRYHELCVPEKALLGNQSCDRVLSVCAPGCRSMRPDSLEDAIQLCSRYCSVGRYLAEWELCSLLAYLWDLELHLDDLGLEPEIAGVVEKFLDPPSADPGKVAAYRSFLARHYLQRSGGTYRDVPDVHARQWGAVVIGPYPDGSTFRGDPDRGALLYQRICHHCHGAGVFPMQGKALVANPRRFYSVLADGTVETEGPYMPEFTLERLSRQQAQDVYAHLRAQP